MDAVRPEFRVLLELLHGLHGFQICFECAPFPCMRFVFQASKLFFGPAPERGMNGLPRGVQIFRDRVGHPAICMQPDDHAASLCRVCDLVQGQSGMLSVGIDDGLAHRWRQGTFILFGNLRRWNGR